MIDGVIANMIVAIELIQKVIDPMSQRKFGRIVNITSGSVKMPLAGLDLSSGARAGLTAFLAGVARTVAANNVTINNILPGAFDTDRLRGTLSKAAEQKGMSVEEAAKARVATIPARAFRRSGRVRRGLRVPVLGAGRLHHRAEPADRRRHLQRGVLELACDAPSPHQGDGRERDPVSTNRKITAPSPWPAAIRQTRNEKGRRRRRPFSSRDALICLEVALLDRRRRRRIVPAIFQRHRDDVDVRVDDRRHKLTPD